MRLKIALCDDDETIRKQISRQLAAFDRDIETDEYSSGNDLIVSGKFYDIYFLDIEMPGISGMEAAKKIRSAGENAFIIFLTSHTEFMQEAFKVRAFRFIEKPIDNAKLIEAFEEAKADISKNQKLAVKSQGNIIMVNTEDIICFEAFGDGTYIHTKNDVICTQMPLKHWMSEINENDFFQVHKSFAVALRHISAIGKNTVTMSYMKDEVPVARRKSAQLRQMYFEHIKANARYV